MNAPSHTNKVSKLPCEAFAKGECTRGAACNLDHPHNLDPARRGDRAEGTEGYEVPNEVGTACLRCVQQLRECDKHGRGGKNDPCSECRHFGGPGCNCMLATSVSYNDQAWGQMMHRSATGFDLAQPKARDALIGKKTDKKTGKVTGKQPMPMPEHEVKPDWHGKTKEQLLGSPDFLPAFVRRLPRAYLVPPRVNEDRKRRNATYGALNRPSALASTRPPATPPTAFQAPCLPAFAPSLRDPILGDVTRIEYASGATLILPRGNVAATSPTPATPRSSSSSPEHPSQTPRLDTSLPRRPPFPTANPSQAGASFPKRPHTAENSDEEKGRR